MTDATTTSLSVSPSAPNLGQSVTLTATVAKAGSAAGIPSGTVEFYDGTIDLGSGTLAPERQQWRSHVDHAAAGL